METEAAVVIMALHHLVMVEIVEEVMVMVAIQGVDIEIIIEDLLHMVIGIVIEEIVDQEDLLGNEGAHHTMVVEVVIGIEIEREEDQEVVVLIIIEGEVDIKLTLEYRKL